MIVMRIREHESKHVQHSRLHYERQKHVCVERIVDRRRIDRAKSDDMHWVLELFEVVHQYVAPPEQF